MGLCLCITVLTHTQSKHTGTGLVVVGDGYEEADKQSNVDCKLGVLHGSGTRKNKMICIIFCSFKETKLKTLR